MNRYKILYIDDDASKHGITQIQPMIDTLEESEDISIEPIQSAPFDTLSKKIKSIIKDYDAIIFDYQLDDRANDEGKTGNIKAPVLAQHLRTEATSSESETIDVPFILCSTDDKLQKSYQADLTSHDLFDLKFRKDKDNILLVAKQIHSLITGYRTIYSTKEFNKILDYDTTNLDERIFTRFNAHENALIPPHEYARTILKDLIYINGPLIDESIFAARLGIDIEKSEDWENLKNINFKEAKYTGAFSEGWDRWWMDSVNDIFFDLTEINLASVDAQQRIALLKEKSSLNKLVLSEKIEGCNSYRYWTVCKSYNKPFDPREGFKAASEKEPKPWQDYSYISKKGHWIELVLMRA